jgi:hypothetical protein
MEGLDDVSESHVPLRPRLGPAGSAPVKPPSHTRVVTTSNLDLPPAFRADRAASHVKSLQFVHL